MLYQLKNSVICDPAINMNLKRLIFPKGTIILNENEKVSFKNSTDMLFKVLQKDKVELDNLLPVSCCFIEDKDFDFEIVDDDAGAIWQSGMIVYRIGKWRSENFNVTMIHQHFLEELVHHFYSSFDEKFVSEKVIECLRITQPQLKYEQVYNSNKYK